MSRAPGPIKAVISDMDGTLTTVVSPWRYIHERIGVWDTRGVPIFQAFLAGQLTYAEFCRLDLDLWMERGVRLADVEAMLKEIPLNPHLGRLTDRLARRGIPIAIVSTGFTATAERIRGASSHEHWHVAANHLFEEAGGRLDIELNVADGEGHPRSKAEVFKGVCEELGVKPWEVLALGDGPSDEQMFRLAGASVRLAGPDCLLQALEIVG